jgi:hypothetical protein
MERRHHYWNGKQGRLARQDIYVYEDAGAWRIEARRGGLEGTSKWYERPSDDLALDCVRDLINMSKVGRWWEMSSLTR